MNREESCSGVVGENKTPLDRFGKTIINSDDQQHLQARNQSNKFNRSRSNRRSLSGAPLTCLFDNKFQHLRAFQKKQNDTRGINFLLAPMTQKGLFYRSSLPVTPLATPLFTRGLRFTEQTLHDRILTQTSRKSRLHSAFNDEKIDETSEYGNNLSRQQQQSTRSNVEPSSSCDNSST